MSLCWEDRNMLIAVLGGLGSGKTLFLTWLGLKSIGKSDVYANFHIAHPKVKFLTPLEFVKLALSTNKNKKYVVLLDEVYGWLDSRCSSSKTNRLLDIIGLQSRKRNMDIFYTAQLGSSVDLRFRDITDIVVKCEKIPNYGFYYSINRQTWRGIKTKKYFIPLDSAGKIWQYYDTTEVVKPIGLNKLIAELQKIEE